MKKIVLYLFLFLMLMKFGSVFSTESNNNTCFQKNQSINYFKPYTSLNSFLNFYFIIDSDTENNEISSQASLSNKNVSPVLCLCYNDFLSNTNTSFKNLNLKKYFLENCSKIIKYNFLSLKVLRI